ncbi:unnamed protein product, partial [marine sediment metagenome]
MGSFHNNKYGRRISYAVAITSAIKSPISLV